MMDGGDVTVSEERVTASEKRTTCTNSDSVTCLGLYGVSRWKLAQPQPDTGPFKGIFGPITYGILPEWLRVRVVERVRDWVDIRYDIVGEFGVVEMGEIKFPHVDFAPLPGRHRFRLLQCPCGTEYLIARHRKPKGCKACYDKYQGKLKRVYLLRQQERRYMARKLKLAYECAHCGESMEASRTTRKYCSTACRVAALRARRAPQPLPDTHGVA